MRSIKQTVILYCKLNTIGCPLINKMCNPIFAFINNVIESNIENGFPF